MERKEEKVRREEQDHKERLVHEKQEHEDKLVREVQARKKNQVRGNGTMEVDKSVHESSRVNMYMPAFNDKEFLQKAFSKQNVKKWKVCDVNWEDNVISEHEETVEDISHRDQNLGQATNFSLCNPKLCEVDLSKEVFEDCAIFENHAIIGRVVGPKLPRSLIKMWVDENWGKNVVIKFLLKSFFIAVFAEAEERDRILFSQNWFLENHPFCLQPWYPNFDPTKLAIYDKPLWVHLYNLPSEYWNLPPLNGPLDGNINLLPKDSSHDISAPDEAPTINITPILDSISLPPLHSQNDNKDDKLSEEESESSWLDDEPKNLDDLDIVDPRCISQSVNALLRRVKGSKGRKSHKVIREQRAHEKGIVSVMDFLKVSKGGKPSLGER
ncbi:hypothetical protein SUGI_1033660 [Cryptomeria japonica]|nr:hypothetical protein SUGI_1033660 [Cryptomeria japonica]